MIHSAERLPYCVVGWRLPSMLVWALESGLYQSPSRDGVASLLCDSRRNNLEFYGYEHIVGVTDQLVHEADRSDHLARALAYETGAEGSVPLIPSAAVVIGRNSYDAPLVLDYSQPLPRVLYFRELELGPRRWVALGSPDELFAALWPGQPGPPHGWVAAGPSPRRWSLLGLSLPPALSRMLCTGRWRSAQLLQVLTLEQMHARRVEFEAHRESRDILAIARIVDTEICLDYSDAERESADAERESADAERESSAAAPRVVMRSTAGTTQVIADTFADWAAVYWPEDAADAAREAPLFAAADVPVRTAPHLWMPGVDPD
jgi:hypothetical protein